MQAGNNNSAQLCLTSFLPALLTQLIPNTMATHAIAYTNFIASLSTGLVAIIAALSSSAISVVLTAIITFVMTAYYYKRKYSYKPTMVTQPVVSKTDVVEYEITKTSPDNMAMTTNPSYDVAMSSNPAYGHNVKKIDQVSDYYS